MNGLPKLLRQLEQAAHDNDEKRMGEVFEQLDRNEGWNDAVDEFVERLGDREYDAIEHFRNIPGDDFTGQGGSSMSGGGFQNPPGFTTKDATSGIFMPQSASEWAQGLAKLGLSVRPSRLWLGQEAAGNFADSINGTTLTAASVAAYRQAVAGWSTLAYTLTDTGGAEEAFNNTDTTLPDISVKSVLSITYIAITATPAAERTVLCQGNGNGLKCNVDASRNAKVYIGGVNNAVGAALGSGVRPWVELVNVTQQQAGLFTDQDKLIPTYTAAASAKAVFVGGAIQTSATQATLYKVQFEGANAEWSPSIIKAVLSALGWTVSWS